MTKLAGVNVAGTRCRHRNQTRAMVSERVSFPHLDLTSARQHQPYGWGGVPEAPRADGCHFFRHAL